MSETHYNKVLPELKTIPPEEVSRPPMSADVYLQETEDLQAATKEHEDELLETDLTKEQIDQLPERIETMRQAQSDWVAVQFGSTAEAKTFEEEAEKGYALRDELLGDFRYAYRKDKTNRKRVANIAEGTDAPDMIQDLSDLAELGEQNPEPLRRIKKFDFAKLAQARQLSNSLATLLAKARISVGDPAKALDLRNRAYTHLHKLVVEIREAAAYLYAGDEVLLKKFSSAHLRKRRRLAKQRAPERARKAFVTAIEQGVQSVVQETIKGTIEALLVQITPEQIGQLDPKQLQQSLQATVKQTLQQEIQRVVQAILA